MGRQHVEASCVFHREVHATRDQNPPQSAAAPPGRHAPPPSPGGRRQYTGAGVTRAKNCASLQRHRWGCGLGIRCRATRVWRSLSAPEHGTAGTAAHPAANACAGSTSAAARGWRRSSAALSPGEDQLEVEGQLMERTSVVSWVARLHHGPASGAPYASPVHATPPQPVAPPDAACLPRVAPRRAPRHICGVFCLQSYLLHTCVHFMGVQPCRATRGHLPLHAVSGAYLHTLRRARRQRGSSGTLPLTHFPPPPTSPKLQR